MRAIMRAANMYHDITHVVKPGPTRSALLLVWRVSGAAGVRIGGVAGALFGALVTNLFYLFLR